MLKSNVAALDVIIELVFCSAALVGEPAETIEPWRCAEHEERNERTSLCRDFCL